MEKNNSKQGGLFQSVASKLSRFFRRESSASAPEPESPNEVTANADPIAADEVARPIATHTISASETTPEAPATPEAPETEMPVAVPQEETHPAPVPDASQQTVPTPVPAQIKVAKEVPLQPKHVAPLRPQPAVQRPAPMPERPVREVSAASAESAAPAKVTVTSISNKRRVHISDLSRDQAERLMSDYVQEHLSDEQLSVETMAAQLKVSRTGLYQLVHDIFEVTPANYILDCRLKHASELLLMGKKVRDVSAKCGFSDPKYFSKVFKKYYGVLPSNYGAAE